MSDARIDKAKGKLKEAAGILTDDEKLKRKGQVEQVAADIKGTINSAVDKAAELLKGK